MPPAMVGPGQRIDAPFAGTPFTVLNSPFVSVSHSTAPSFAEYARNRPAFSPEKIAPGMTVIAAACAALQRPPPAHFGGCGGANHARSPVVRLTACSPPG